MSVKDFSNAWDQAAQRVLVTHQENELTPIQLTSTAGMHVRTGVAAGGTWGTTGGPGCTSKVCTTTC